jgi:tetratricopeptide (TPR) repeat protein
MKRHFAGFVLVLLMLGLCAPPVFSQATSVKGVCKDTDGKLLVGAVVVYANQDTGQKYVVPPTNKKGEYFTLGVAPGSYNVTLYRNADDEKANKELFHFNKFPVKAEENTLDFDLKKMADEQAKNAPPEQAKAQESNEKIKKENITIKALNEKIVAANTSMKAGDFDTAMSTMTEATQLDPTRDVLWALLGDSYRGSALKQTDPAEKARRLQEAVNDYQKAIEIKQKALDTAPVKDPVEVTRLANYYNNLGEALGKSGKVDDALKAYAQAAQVNPGTAAQYYFNAGAVLTNIGKIDAANAAFDKAIAADPTRADTYYQKGVNMIGKATLQGDKMVAPPGTAEAFNKYLELAPNGPYAQTAKDMLASIGAAVQTSIGKKKGAKN